MKIKIDKDLLKSKIVQTEGLSYHLSAGCPEHIGLKKPNYIKCRRNNCKECWFEAINNAE